MVLISGSIILLSPALARIIAMVWMKGAEYMGWVSSKIILGAVFYLVLFPLSLFARISRKDILKKKKYQSDTYYILREREFDMKGMEKMW